MNPLNGLEFIKYPMMTSDDKPIIYVDTNCLRDLSLRDSDWRSLLEAAKQRTLRIAISEIAFQERRSQWRDRLKADAERVKDAIDKLNNTWNESPVTRDSSINDNPHILTKINIESFEDDIETKVSDYSDSFIRKHFIEIRNVQEHQTKEVLRKYFDWEGVFHKPSRDRDNKNVRGKRRENIPDAWIVEEALDFKTGGGILYVLCKDKNVTKVLHENGINVFEVPGEILSELNMKQQQEPSVESVQQDIDADNNSVRVDNINKLINADLIIKVLGYMHWLAEGGAVSKEILIGTLHQRYGYTPEQIRITADYLNHVSQVLEDTNNYYIAIDSESYRSAADEVLFDVLLLLDDE